MTMEMINPGTGDVEGASLENANIAISRFVQDLGEPAKNRALYTRDPERDSGGRFGYLLYLVDNPEQAVEVDMPGCDPEVTQAGEPFRSPRLYVDGSSWLWGFALGIVEDRLMGDS